MTHATHTSAQLLVGALLFGVISLLAPEALPLRLVGLVLLLAGYLGVLGRLGLERPLNRLSAVSASLGAAAYTGWLCVEPVQPRLGFFGMMALLAALFVTGIAALHREGVLRRVGAIGAVSAGAPLLALLAGHLALGGYGFLGLAWGRSAVGAGQLVTWPIDLLVALIAAATGLAWRRIAGSAGAVA